MTLDRRRRAKKAAKVEVLRSIALIGLPVPLAAKLTGDTALALAIGVALFVIYENAVKKAKEEKWPIL